MTDENESKEQASGASKPESPSSAPAGQQAAPASSSAEGSQQQREAEQPPTGEFKSEESKSSVLADLRKERDARQELEAKINAQNQALMEAFGVAEPPKEQDLAETVKSLQEQIAHDRREAFKERLAASNGIIEEKHKALLTEKDPEKLQAQAETVAALVKAQNAGDEVPAFVHNPGQGQGGSSTAPDLNAEYEKYYPSSTRK